MPPEFGKSGHISSKYDVFSLGVLIINVMDGNRGLTRYREMRTEQFVNHVCMRNYEELRFLITPYNL